MKDQLRTELKTHLPQKISAALILVALFLASVQLVSYGINSNSGAIQETVEVIADLQNAESFREYYTSTNNTAELDKVNNITDNLLDNASRGSEYGQIVYVGRVTGSALSVIDPFYSVPCTVTSEKNCRLYLNSETVQEINQTLDSAGTDQALREFAEKHRLNASEGFYENYAANRSSAETGTSGLEQNLSRKNLDTWTYIVNILYLAFVGFLITSAASIIYRTMNGDES